MSQPLTVPCRIVSIQKYSGMSSQKPCCPQGKLIDNICSNYHSTNAGQSFPVPDPSIYFLLSVAYAAEGWGAVMAGRASARVHRETRVIKMSNRVLLMSRRRSLLQCLRHLFRSSGARLRGLLKHSLRCQECRLWPRRNIAVLRIFRFVRQLDLDDFLRREAYIKKTGGKTAYRTPRSGCHRLKS